MISGIIYCVKNVLVVRVWCPPSALRTSSRSTPLGAPPKYNNENLGCVFNGQLVGFAHRVLREGRLDEVTSALSAGGRGPLRGDVVGKIQFRSFGFGVVD